ncbi:DnaA regulatory inactivator Hda [Teredinibacter turnerae]|uniref:DnaA regulatory inactivator Hda n=1 Tax=Teredinibacter turnerae TaxID=2426 RepID=UPI000369F982|nr:DnaA regulatory inactivator Hda [Teredinibacter turnerae]
MAAQPQQLSLGIALHEEATFANYLAVGSANRQAVDALEKVASGASLENTFVWGAHGTGLSHLLQAVCHQASDCGRSLQYFPMADVRGYAPAALCEGLEDLDLVCLDGIEHICGSREWEQSLFHLFNRMRDAGKTLVFSSHVSPAALPIVLPDLKSRLMSCIIYHLESLTDDAKKAALQQRAHERGFDMPEEVASFILNRASRDTAELFELLDKLDDASLQAQRKLTIPFVKSVLEL